MWKPEHMWRSGPGVSPSRARRAAVNVSSGAAEPHASKDWLSPGAAQHRLDGSYVRILARVRGGHDGNLLFGQVESVDAARFDERSHSERLDRRPQRDEDVRIADAPLHLAGGIDLHDVAAVTALHDRPATHFDEHRRGGALRVARARCGRTGGRPSDGPNLCLGHPRRW